MFHTEIVKMTDGQCRSAGRTLALVKPGAEFTTWGFFPAIRHHGEKVAIHWGGFGTTPFDFVMPA